MDVKDAIQARRAYRSLVPVEITDETINEIAKAAKLTASCFNNQPWQYVFVKNSERLKQMHETLSGGNSWAFNASMIIAVFSKLEDDCNIHGREYFLFDTGMATYAMILRATELGLVAHPIAGFREDLVKETLDIPDEMKVITLVIVGIKSDSLNPILSEKQIEHEKKRPTRKKIEDFAYIL